MANMGSMNNHAAYSLFAMLSISCAATVDPDAHCTVTDDPEGARIECPDGSSAVVAGRVATADDSDEEVEARYSDAPIQLEQYASGVRLELTELLGEDGSRYVGTTYWDTELGVYCAPSMHADGSLRCLPLFQAVTYDLLWTSDCSAPLADATAATDPLYVVEPVEVDATGEPLGHAASRVYMLGAEYEGSVSTMAGAQCSGRPDVSGTGKFTLGDEVPADAFVEFTAEAGD